MEKFRTPFWILGNSISGIKSINWIGNTLDSFANCGTLIVDVTTLTDQILTNISWDRVKDLHEEINKRFLAGGEIICILQNRRVIVKETSSIDNYFWSPLYFQTFQINRGRGWESDDDCKLDGYLKNVKHWDLRIGDPNSSNEIGIISNDNNETLGGLYTSSSTTSGKFLILPPLDDPSNSLTVLVESLNLFEKTPPPSWTEQITITKIEELKKLISPIDEKISTLEKEKAKHQSEIKKIENYKKLLYCKGNELHDSTKTALEFLGLDNVRLGDQGKDDLLFDLTSTDFKLGSVEVKGKDKGAKLDDFRELDHWVTDHQSKGISTKGMMVINTHRLEDISKNKAERMDFSNFEYFYQPRNHCVMPTITLFELVKYKLEGNDIQVKKIEETIVNSSGILTLNDFTK